MTLLSRYLPLTHEFTIRKKRVRVTRNNVIFEFGLFMGRLEIERSFLLLEEGVAQFSDWSGIETTRFRRSDNLMSAVGSACDRIRNEMLTAEKLQHFTMLPSTSLAIGYYNNFLKRVFDAFEISDFYTVVERDEKGQIVREDRCRITDRRPLIHVKLPRRLRDLESDQLKEKTSLYRQIAVTTRFREFPFYIGNESDTDTNLTLFDIPTTMLSSKIAIEKIFSAQFLARDNILERLENREIINFERTLRIMVPDKLEHKYFKFSILE